MDAALLQCYRLVWADITMLWDAASIYYHRRPIGGYNLTDFAAGLSLLIDNENDLNVSDPLSDEDEEVDFTADTTAIRQLLWQFTHGVALEFIAEELSQFPFWSAKVNTVVTNRGKSFVDTVWEVFSFYQGKLRRGGFRAIFEANVPYVAAAAVVHHQHLQKSISFFLGMMRSLMPRHPSGNISSHYPKKSILSSSKSKNKVKKSKGMSILSKLTTAVVIHPLLVLSVRMLTSPSLVEQNWISAYFSIVTSEGLSTLYTGLRISIICALIPLSPWYTLGIPETVLYRRMAGQGGNDSLAGSYSVIYDAIADEGSLGLLSFGLLTVCQAAPGFFTFAATRSLLWLICGTTMQRRRQYKRRKEILEDLWPKAPQVPFSPPSPIN